MNKVSEGITNAICLHWHMRRFPEHWESTRICKQLEAHRLSWTEKMHHLHMKHQIDLTFLCADAYTNTVTVSTKQLHWPQLHFVPASALYENNTNPWRLTGAGKWPPPQSYKLQQAKKMRLLPHPKPFCCQVSKYHSFRRLFQVIRTCTPTFALGN